MFREVTKESSKQKKNNDQDRNTIIPKYKLWAKGSISPYPSEDGNPFYSGDLDAEDFLEEMAIVQSRNETNCEWVVRPGMAVCFAASAITHGLRELKKDVAHFHAPIQEFLAAHKEFGEAVRTLNVGKDNQRSKGTVKNALKTFVPVIATTTPEFHTAVVKLAIHSARIYQFAMHMLETKALFQNPQVYAKKLVHAMRQTTLDKETETWSKHPKDQKKLIEMLTVSLQAKMRRRYHGDIQTKTRKPRSPSQKSSEDEKVESSQESQRSDESSRSKSTPVRKERKKKNEKSPKKSRKQDKKRKDDKNQKNQRKRHAEKTEDILERKRKNARLTDSTSDKEQAEASSQRAPSPAGPHAKGNDLIATDNPNKQKPAIVFKMSDQESDSESEEEKEQQRLLMWPEKELTTFASEVTEGLKHLGDKGKRLSLSALVALLDSVPDELRKDNNLEEHRENLKQFTRLPRLPKVERLLKQMQVLADKAIAAHCLSSAPEREDKQGTPGEASNPKKETLLKWPETFVDNFLQEVAAAQKTKTENPEEPIEKKTLAELTKLVPAEVQLYYPLLIASISAMEESNEKRLNDSIVQDALSALTDIGKEAKEARGQSHKE